MRPFLRTFHETLLDLWSHRLTAFIGGTATLLNVIDVATKLGGLAAVLVAVYCSLARNARDKRESEARLAAIGRETPRA